MRIPFYFDYACPWAYLGSCRVDSYFRDLGCEIEARPVHLATLREPSSGDGPEPGPRKKAHYLNDLRHWAEMVGAEISPEVRQVMRTDTRLALQATLVARDRGRDRELRLAAFRARWGEARDLSRPEILRELLAKSGLDPEACLAAAASEEVARRLERETQDAIARGVFGVPTLLVGERLFWGNDRFELARYFAQKGAAGPAQHEPAAGTGPTAPTSSCAGPAAGAARGSPPAPGPRTAPPPRARACAPVGR
jgi:2-hydroxychromene-2-carboxylate isomerase